MDRYIDEKDVVNLMYSLHLDKMKFNNNKNVIDFIKDIPAADVVEVVHGEWITVTLSSDRKVILCSNCRGHLETFGLTDYCPNCGAKMDGKKVE